jgi:hypothetical protein
LQKPFLKSYFFSILLFNSFAEYDFLNSKRFNFILQNYKKECQFFVIKFYFLFKILIINFLTKRIKKEKRFFENFFRNYFELKKIELIFKNSI